MVDPNARGATFDEFVEGAGLITDAPVTWRSVRFCEWDYQGKVNPPVLAAKIDMVDADGKVHDHYASAGDLKYFRPSPDGKKAIPQTDSVKKMNKHTNFILTLLSLMDADTRGELAAKVRQTDDVSVLDNVKVWIHREPQPTRPGIVSPEMLAQQAQGGRSSRAAEYIKVEKVLAYPWESAPAASASPATVVAAVGAGAVQVAAAAPAGNAEVTGAAIGALVPIIAANGGPLKVTAIVGKIFADPGFLANPTAIRNQVLGIITKPEFLSSGPWAYNAADGTVSLG